MTHDVLLKGDNIPRYNIEIKGRQYI
jgi:hypothetical protein